MEPNTQMNQENIAGGFVGALFGAMIGAAAILIFDRFGLISSFSGLIMAFATLRGYTRGASVLSRRGIVICSGLMLAAVYLGVRAAWALAVIRALKQVGYSDTFFNVFSWIGTYVREIGKFGEYLNKYLLTYLFTIIGAIPIIKSSANILKNAEKGDRLSAAEGSTAALLTDEDGFHLYLPNPSWSRGYENSTLLAAGIHFVGVIILGNLDAKETSTLRGILTLALLAGTFIVFFVGRKLADSDKEKNLAILRTDIGEFWCMRVEDLDGYRDYRFNGYPFGIPAFSSGKLYERMKQSAKDMAEAARGCDREAFRTYNMMPQQMNQIRLEKEKVTVWNIAYTDQANQSQRLKLPKIYKDLSIRGSEYRPQGPIRDYRFLGIAGGIGLIIVVFGLILIR